eukprot:SAG11_NODE_16581_length_543_cov_1.731982_1_plen_46_part_10
MGRLRSPAAILAVVGIMSTALGGSGLNQVWGGLGLSLLVLGALVLS